jgi:hypothetical protein
VCGSNDAAQICIHCPERRSGENGGLTGREDKIWIRL